MILQRCRCSRGRNLLQRPALRVDCAFRRCRRTSPAIRTHDPITYRTTRAQQRARGEADHQGVCTRRYARVKTTGRSRVSTPIHIRVNLDREGAGALDPLGGTNLAGVTAGHSCRRRIIGGSAHARARSATRTGGGLAYLRLAADSRPVQDRTGTDRSGGRTLRARRVDPVPTIPPSWTAYRIRRRSPGPRLAGLGRTHRRLPGPFRSAPCCIHRRCPCSRASGPPRDGF